MRTAEMSHSRWLRAAVVFALLPAAAVAALHFAGARPVFLHWRGSLFRPTGLGIEFHGVGLILVALSMAGGLASLVLFVRCRFHRCISRGERSNNRVSPVRQAAADALSQGGTTVTKDSSDRVITRNR
jgi:hypothetical protein